MMDFMDCDVPSGAARNGTKEEEEEEEEEEIVNYSL